jgi:hypothetical protein
MTMESVDGGVEKNASALYRQLETRVVSVNSIVFSGEKPHLSQYLMKEIQNSIELSHASQCITTEQRSDLYELLFKTPCKRHQEENF